MDRVCRGVCRGGDFVHASGRRRAGRKRTEDHLREADDDKRSGRKAGEGTDTDYHDEVDRPREIRSRDIAEEVALHNDSDDERLDDQYVDDRHLADNVDDEQHVDAG